jgi:hypothetical protein
MAVIPADNREMYMNTKPFTNMFGSEVQVGRDEFVQRWADETYKFANLFLVTNAKEDEELYNAFQDRTKELAGKKWDSK